MVRDLNIEILAILKALLEFGDTELIDGFFYEDREIAPEEFAQRATVERLLDCFEEGALRQRVAKMPCFDQHTPAWDHQKLIELWPWLQCLRGFKVRAETSSVLHGR